jgi:hypothetical protein
MLDGLMQGADRDLVKVWQKMNAPRFDNIMLKTKTVGARPRRTASWCSSRARARRRSRSSTTWCCRRWAAAQRQAIGADKAGVVVGERGFIPVDVQMRTNVPHIFAIGDIVGQPMLAHKAVHEAHVAPRSQRRRQGAVRCARDPERGLHRPRGRLGGADRGRGQGQGHQGQEGPVPVDACGRAIANTRDEGFTKLLFSEEDHRIVGGGIVGTHAGDLISEVALAIEMGADEVGHRQDHPPAPRRWARASAWPRKPSKAPAPTCRRSSAERAAQRPRLLAGREAAGDAGTGAGCEAARRGRRNRRSGGCRRHRPGRCCAGGDLARTLVERRSIGGNHFRADGRGSARARRRRPSSPRHRPPRCRRAQCRAAT